MQNVHAHELRMDNARRVFFHSNDVTDLNKSIVLPANLDNRLFKCRIVYNQKIQKVEFLSYTPKIINTLRIVSDESILYSYKYLDRSSLDTLVRSSDADDILIVQHGLVTDISIANIVFFDGKKWFTPKKPLLFGIKRQILLEKRLIHESDISVKELHKFEHAALINAMLDIGDMPFIPIKNILPPI